MQATMAAMRSSLRAWTRLHDARGLQQLMARAPTLQMRARATSAVRVNTSTIPVHGATAVRSISGSATGAGVREDDDSEKKTFANPETRILEHALHYVSEHGWTVEALAAGATELGYPSVAHGMLPRGAIDLVDFFMDRCYEQTLATLTAHTSELQALPVTERLKFGVRTRLQLLAPVLSTWPQAMALGALPQNAPTTMQKLAQLSDEIWYFAGDKSTDASWYTKRAILTGIYASTELFMLSDESPNFEETWRFLDRRIEETVALGELPRNLNDVAGMVTIGLQSFLSAAVSLAGPLSSQIVKNSPLGNVPNPISAIGSIVPSSVAAGLATGFPPNPLAGLTPPHAPFDVGSDLEQKDLREIDDELEKFGGSDVQPRK